MTDVIARAREAMSDLDTAHWRWLHKVDNTYAPEGDTEAVLNWCQETRCTIVPDLIDALTQARAEVAALRAKPMERLQ